MCVCVYNHTQKDKHTHTSMHPCTEEISAWLLRKRPSGGSNYFGQTNHMVLPSFLPTETHMYVHARHETKREQHLLYCSCVALHESKRVFMHACLRMAILILHAYIYIYIYMTMCARTSIIFLRIEECHV